MGPMFGGEWIKTQARQSTNGILLFLSINRLPVIWTQIFGVLKLRVDPSTREDNIEGEK